MMVITKCVPRLYSLHYTQMKLQLFSATSSHNLYVVFFFLKNLVIDSDESMSNNSAEITSSYIIFILMFFTCIW